MKKGLMLLLIAALIAGAAFASFSGSAKITFDADLDDKEFGFNNLATGKLVFEFTFDTLDETKDTHETDLWAEIGFKGSVDCSASVRIASNTPVWRYDEVGKQGEGGISASFKVTKADIHIHDFTFGILNSGTGVDYAWSYYKEALLHLLPENDVVEGPEKLLPGFTVDYKGWRGGFGIEGSMRSNRWPFAVVAHGESKKYTFGSDDAIYAQAGGYIWYYSDVRVGAPDKNAGGAFQTGYKSDRLTADFATDLRIVRKGGKNKFEYEVSFDSTYTINDRGSLELSIYAAPGILTSSGKKYADSYKNTVKLDSRLLAKYKFDLNGTEIKTESYVDIRDSVINAREIELYTEQSFKIMNDKLALKSSQSYKIFSSVLELTAKATYTHEKFETWVALTSLAYNFNEKEFSAFNVSCGITSEAIIENAEIGLTYKKANFVRKEDGSFKKLGTIEAYASVSFE
ncbi:MAG: hypothetical protein LIR25_01010 [bacterium]|nr:hypothetical protein [bacterium]